MCGVCPRIDKRITKTKEFGEIIFSLVKGFRELPAEDPEGVPKYG